MFISNYWVQISILLSLYLFKETHTFSGCDDVDIIFVIDTDSIINNGDNIIDFIKSIIWDGSSESAGFSAVLYGDDIPNDIKPNVVKLRDNCDIKQRQDEERRIIRKLDQVFRNVKNSNSDNTKSVSLLKAFEVANKQPKPQRDHRKRQRFGIERVGSQDDENEFFIFDYYNKLIYVPEIVVNDTNDTDIDYNLLYRTDAGNNNDDLCYLLNHNNDNNDETVHFLFGQFFDKLDLICDNEYPIDLIDKRTFFYFDDILTDNRKRETIYDITCPAIINVPEYGGNFDLGNHDQWIDIDTIIECDLDKIENTKIEQPTRINPETSYILAKDYINDDNTFKIGDYLLTAPDDQQEMESIGCWGVVYRIMDIEIVDGTSYDQYNEIKLYVMFPRSPTEYILTANLEGDHIPFASYRAYPQNGSEPNGNGSRSLLSFVKLEGEGTQSLFDKTFGDEWEWTKTVTRSTSFGSKPKVTLTGTGTITITAGFAANIDIELYFDFTWDVLSNDIYIKFTITVDWSVEAWFNVEFVAQFIATIEDLISFSKPYAFVIGVVPVVIEPFVKLDASLETIPLRLFAEFRCYYGETYVLGYEYDKWTTFDAEYGTIRSNYRYNLGTKKTWTGISLEDCVRQNYEYGAGAGLTCVWFDYNPSQKKCRCYGAGTMVGQTTSESGTTAYLMNRGCRSGVGGCAGCGTDIWVKRDCKHCCGLFKAFDDWYCRDCPVLQKNSGKETTVIRKNSPIRSRTVHSQNGCTPTLEIGSEEENQESCPAIQLGFDIDVEVKVGANLYSIITAYAKGLLEVPFRITIPNFDDTLSGCSGSSVQQSCQNSLMAAMTYGPMDLSFYFGYGVDFGDLKDIVESLWNGGSQAIDIDFDIFMNEIQIGSTIEILGLQSLGCLPLKPALSLLDSYYKPKCCPDWALQTEDCSSTVIMKRNEGYWFSNSQGLSYNPTNPDANVYSIIGDIAANKNQYINSDGKYQFRLTYDNIDGTTYIIEWKQSSFPTDSGTITGYEPINVPQATTTGDCNAFNGLGRSQYYSRTTSHCLLDGTGSSSCWWNAVGNRAAYQNGGSPGYNGIIAMSEKLEIIRDEYIVIMNRKQNHYYTNPREQNPSNPNANVYSIIDDIQTNKADYKNSVDDKYQFRLTFENEDGTTSVLIWRQSSFPTDSGTITGYEEMNIPSESRVNSNCQYFNGLGLSGSSNTLLDGTGSGSCWWNSVGTKSEYQSGGSPGFNRRIAYAVKLEIYNVQLCNEGASALPILPEPDDDNLFMRKYIDNHDYNNYRVIDISSLSFWIIGGLIVILTVVLLIISVSNIIGYYGKQKGKSVKYSKVYMDSEMSEA